MLLNFWRILVYGFIFLILFISCVGYSVRSFSSSGSYIDSIFYFFDPFIILRFFDVLLIPVFPLILIGIVIGHKSFITPKYFSSLKHFGNLLSCGVPIFFILSCVLSSLYILLFFRQAIKTFAIQKIEEIFNLLKEGADLDSIIIILSECKLRVGDADIYLFDDNFDYEVIEEISHYVNDSELPSNVLNNFAEYILRNVEEEFLDTSAPYSIYLPDLAVEWKFLFDDLTVSIFLVVSVITFLVILFAWVYISADERRPIFFFLLTLFAGFMMVLVASYNYFILFIGWEGVGLSSFLLINFWYTRAQANKAAAKAVMVNRVGDIFLITALGLLYYNTNTLNFSSSTERLLILNDSYLVELVCLFLFLAAVGKSAQLGLHTWLPDAIEGPTPVSALLHAATIVTAGVYLLLRSSVLISNSTFVSSLIAVAGLLTAFFAATAALIQYDIKKVIAYSTCSQLGYIIIGVGLKQFNVAFFHLFNHAFFKALLFIAAGSVIHSLINEQDMRRMGGLGMSSFYLFLSNSVGVAALAGSLFLSGFYSKDLILESSVSTFTISGLVVYWVATLTAIFTGIYSSDSLDDVFIEETNLRKKVLENLHSISLIESLVLFILVLFSLFSGYLFKDIFIGLGSPFLNSAFESSVEAFSGNQFAGVSNWNANIIVSSEFLPMSLKLLPVVLSFIIGFQCYKMERTVYQLFACVTFMSYKWYFDMLQNRYFVYNFFRLGYSIFWIWDKYLFEQFRLPKFVHKK